MFSLASRISPYARQQSEFFARLSSHISVRSYAKPSGVSGAAESTSRPTPSIENGHSIGESPPEDQSFDLYLEETAMSLFGPNLTDVATLYSQYHKRAGRVLDRIVPYEEKPASHRRVDLLSGGRPADPNATGNGIVMVVHVLLKSAVEFDKVCACSGFVVDAQPFNGSEHRTDTIITCAHTLEEIHRYWKSGSSKQQTSFSFIIPSEGHVCPVRQVLSSMPRSDIIALEAAPPSISRYQKLRSLPLSPFPVHNGEPVLTHLFNASKPPAVKNSVSRLPPKVNKSHEIETIQFPEMWPQQKAWRRWGSGVMLGYRSYTGIEVEAGIHSSLPHVMTSVLPTPGSSGGPLVNADGAVIGMISGRRMDNRVEGERGWGASAEGIFEMFSLPGFTPTGNN